MDNDGTDVSTECQVKMSRRVVERMREDGKTGSLCLLSLEAGLGLRDQVGAFEAQKASPVRARF